MASKNSIKVLVTGASGFVATHCVQQLLVGGYTVRGTVRSLKNPEKVQPLRDLNFAKERLELVEADLEKPDTWPKAVDSCKYVLHVASPFPTTPDENTIKVAVDGTLNVLKACAKCHSVEKVVLTSSIAAITYGHEDSNKTFTEKDWTNIDGKSVNDYLKSKTIAERAAWDFVKSIPEGDNKFKLTCLNPGGVFGPSLTDIQGTSVEIVKRLLNHEMPGLPHLGVAAVDVRDVAKAHILAMENPNSDGERILLCHEASLWLTDLAKFLDKEFGPHGYCIPKRNLPYFLVWLASFFDSSVKGILPMIGHAVKIDNSKAKNILHLEFIHPEKSLVDMGYSLIERGIVPKKSGYKPRTRL
uniref:3-beta hydroxysteroid dehydrogenase/isomerase domain-containing protein n=2 Tax=Acrobeloides nanus TaxID=290746 RepID=A0A914C0D5_9BILA